MRAKSANRRSWPDMEDISPNRTFVVAGDQQTAELILEEDEPIGD